MALTLEEQQELQQLLAQRSQLTGQPETMPGLTAAEQQELANLQRARSEALPAGVEPFPPEQVGAFAGSGMGPEGPEGTRFPLGAVAGGTLGGFLGVPGGLPGVMLGGGLGAAGGEAAEQLIRRAVGAEAPATSAEAAREIAIQGGLGVAGELGGQAVVRAGQAVGRAVAPALRPGVEGIVKAIQPAFPESPSILRSKWNPIRSLFRDPELVPALLPAQMTENFALDNIQEVSKKALIGGGKIIRAQETTDRIVSDLVEDFVVKLTDDATIRGTGELVVDSLNRGTKAFSAAGRGLYDNVDNLIGAAKVDIRSLKAAAADMLSKVSLKRINSQQISLLKDILEQADEIAFADAHMLRSDLLGVGRTGTELIGGRAQGTAKHLASRIDSAMRNSAQGISPQAEQAWRIANEFWAKGKQTFNSKFIKGLVNTRPSSVLDSFLRKGAASDIAMLRETINDPAIWRKVQGQFARKILDTGITDEFSGALGGSAMLRALRRTFGPDTVKAVAPKGELELLKKYAKALALNQARQPGGAKATVLMSALQLSFGGKLIWDVVGPGNVDIGTAGAFGVVFGPGALARAIINPRVNKVILEGFKVTPKVKAMSSFIARLSAVLAKENIDARIVKGEEARAPLSEPSLTGAI